MSNAFAPNRSYLCAERASQLTVKTYWLPVDVCGGGSLFDELGCFLRVRHIGHMAGIHFDRLGIVALRHHPLLTCLHGTSCLHIQAPFLLRTKSTIQPCHVMRVHSNSTASIPLIAAQPRFAGGRGSVRNGFWGGFWTTSSPQIEQVI